MRSRCSDGSHLVSGAVCSVIGWHNARLSRARHAARAARRAEAGARGSRRQRRRGEAVPARSQSGGRDHASKSRHAVRLRRGRRPSRVLRHGAAVGRYAPSHSIAALHGALLGGTFAPVGRPAWQAFFGQILNPVVARRPASAIDSLTAFERALAQPRRDCAGYDR